MSDRARAATRAIRAASGLLAAFGACAEPAREPPRHAVVLIVLDALAAPHVSHLGYERCTTPNLDHLAAHGTTFRRALAPAPYTLASIPSLLTGALPDRHGVVQKHFRLGEADPTLAESLRAAGWRTLGAVANFNGSSAFGCERGFEEFVELFRVGDGRAADAFEGGEAFHRARAPDFLPPLERWLAARERRPPFLYLHVLEPHEPYDPPSCFRELWLDPAYDGAFARCDSAILIAQREGSHPASAADREAVRALYDGNVAYADWLLGEVFERLRGAGLFDEALVIVTSDHGEAFWEHGEQGHNWTLHSEMLHVPLVVKFPASWRRPRAEVERTVSTLDVFPSLCAWLDLPRPAGARWDGAPLEEAAQDGERRFVLRTNALHPDLALQEGDWKTIYLRGPREGPRVRAYDLARDPGEAQPLGLDAASRVREDAAFLHEYASAAELAQRAKLRHQGGRELTAEEEALLEQLGYTD